MGKLKCFEIIFDSNRNVYHPGERVTGQCVVELKGDMKMRALRFAETFRLVSLSVRPIDSLIDFKFAF